MWDLSSLTRDGTCTRCSESVESSPLDHQGSPQAYPFNVWFCFFFFKDSVSFVHSSLPGSV